MSFRSNARTFPVAFPVGHGGGAWEQGGPRLPVGFFSSVEAPDAFAASGYVAAFGSFAAAEAKDAFAASGAVTTPSGFASSMNFSDARNSGYVAAIGA